MKQKIEIKEMNAEQRYNHLNELLIAKINVVVTDYCLGQTEGTERFWARDIETTYRILSNIDLMKGEIYNRYHYIKVITYKDWVNW